MADPIVLPAGEHGHRWIACAPPGARFQIAVLAWTEAEARAKFTASWEHWEALLFDGDR